MFSLVSIIYKMNCAKVRTNIRISILHNAALALPIYHNSRFQLCKFAKSISVPHF
uniref:Uncharacterized protein n=1 Tax=Arundo donax TaxID=35708 RepID=A0A0A8YLJ1_ARUDO